MRRDKEVREEVLSRPGRYRVVGENLRVKEVWVEGRRYILCYNPKEAKREAMERGLILETLREKLSQGPKALVGNRGFRRYLVAEKGTFRIDSKKVKEEARYDGKWVLRTNTGLPAAEVAEVAPVKWTLVGFVKGGASYAEDTATISAGVQAADRGVGAGWAQHEGTGQRIRALLRDDPQLGEAS